MLNGAGASGVETLLRNVLTPNAAMEAGYRAFRVETRDGEVNRCCAACTSLSDWPAFKRCKRCGG